MALPIIIAAQPGWAILEPCCGGSNGANGAEVTGLTAHVVIAWQLLPLAGPGVELRDAGRASHYPVPICGEVVGPPGAVILRDPAGRMYVPGLCDLADEAHAIRYFQQRSDAAAARRAARRQAEQAAVTRPRTSARDGTGVRTRTDTAHIQPGLVQEPTSPPVLVSPSAAPTAPDDAHVDDDPRQRRAAYHQEPAWTTPTAFKFPRS